MSGTIPAMLPVLALQFGLSLNLRSFLFPIGIGIFGHFVSLVSSTVPVAGVRPGYYMPWSYPLRALRVSGSGVEHLLVELAIASAMGLAILWAAQLYFTERGRGRSRRSVVELGDPLHLATRLRSGLWPRHRAPDPVHRRARRSAL